MDQPRTLVVRRDADPAHGAAVPCTEALFTFDTENHSLVADLGSVGPVNVVCLTVWADGGTDAAYELQPAYAARERFCCVLRLTQGRRLRASGPALRSR